jgi:hypothetical protein
MKILDIPQSGSVGGVTSAHNRFGQYRRARSIPVNPNSPKQGQVRARLSANAAAWRTLTANQREGWDSLGMNVQRNDALGQSYTLTGFMAYCMVNNLNLTAGNAIVADAPAISTPSTLTTATVTLTAAAFSVAFTVTPLAAGARLFAFASPQRSAGRQFEGDFRLISVSAAAAASPVDLFTPYVARFGTPIVGQKVFLSLVTYLAGFESGPLITSAVVAT